MLIDPPAFFYKQEVTAWHLRSSGQLDHFILPDQTTAQGTWSLRDGKLQLTPPASRYNKMYGFRWDGEKFISVAPLSPQPPKNAALTADDAEQETDADDDFLSKTEQANFKRAGWHYKLLPIFSREAEQSTLSLPLRNSIFQLTLHNFPASDKDTVAFDPTKIGIRSMELAGDKLNQPPPVLWSQQGWRKISKSEFLALYQRSGHGPIRSSRNLWWLLAVLLLLVWKFGAWFHVLFNFGTMKRRILKNMANSYSFPPATPGQFPALDVDALERYTLEIERLGFTRLMDFSLTPDKGNHPTSFCRLMVHTRHHCFAEISQIFPRGKKPMPLKIAFLATMQDGWTLSFGNRKPLAASLLIRRKRGLGVNMPEAGAAELLQSFLKMRDQVCIDLGISIQTDDSLEAYITRVQRTLADMREAVQQRNFAVSIPQFYLRRLSLIKTKPEYVWLGDYLRKLSGASRDSWYLPKCINQNPLPSKLVAPTRFVVGSPATTGLSASWSPYRLNWFGGLSLLAATCNRLA